MASSLTICKIKPSKVAIISKIMRKKSNQLNLHQVKNKALKSKDFLESKSRSPTLPSSMRIHPRLLNRPRLRRMGLK